MIQERDGCWGSLKPIPVVATRAMANTGSGLPMDKNGTSHSRALLPPLRAGDRAVGGCTQVHTKPGMMLVANVTKAWALVVRLRDDAECTRPLSRRRSFEVDDVGDNARKRPTLQTSPGQPIAASKKSIRGQHQWEPQQSQQVDLDCLLGFKIASVCSFARLVLSVVFGIRLERGAPRFSPSRGTPAFAVATVSRAPPQWWIVRQLEACSSQLRAARKLSSLIVT
jgi:hypothetical protein